MLRRGGVHEARSTVQIPKLAFCHCHNAIMTTVRIADLKARLREHLRSVKKGHTLTVLDRGTPVARIVPYAETIEVRRATRRLRDLRLPPPPAAATDSLAILLDDRRRR